ncbi:MAG: hypothetical protein NXI03_04160 [Alphaproteobacteria bacterium]|uniref:hypothetical protein n=1 Tax=Maricaulis alexandrii TaxID=2570354 RepID=UPI00110936F9|nr:hypothetical protein [Maricaulis alexandrii]MCR9266742.1 hypothetical protein [Alphaproteobacteria bacterium]
MISPGSWVLQQVGDIRAILEVNSSTGYVYIWDPDRGVLSHVWLYNCEGVVDGHACSEADDAPIMRVDNIKLDFYRIPNSLTEVECIFDEISSTWTVSICGQSIACLKIGSRPGKSIFAKRPTEMAAPWNYREGL